MGIYDPLHRRPFGAFVHFWKNGQGCALRLPHRGDMLKPEAKKEHYPP